MNQSREFSDSALRLPKLVEADPRAEALAAFLRDEVRPLWRGARLKVVSTPLGDSLRAVLVDANRAGRLVRGLEACSRALDAQARGQRKVDRRTGRTRGVRVSRLLLLSDDGAERFYRQVERCVLEHEGRAMALRLETDAADLGQLLFGPDRPTRAVMLTHKESVAAALLATAPS